MARATRARQWAADWWATSFPFDWNQFLDEVSSEPIPDHLKRWWFALAGTPLYLFVIQVVTGITLAFYYTPTPEAAFESVAHITNEVRYGWYSRFPR